MTAKHIADARRAAFQHHFASSEELCAYVRDVTGDTVVLSFSLGKDSWAAFVQCKRYFRRLVPFFLELIPGLGFVEDELKRAEDFLGEPITRYPHPGFVRLLRTGALQPPERLAMCDGLARMPKMDYAAIEQHFRDYTKLEEAFTAVGVRAADSPDRLSAIRKHGSLNAIKRSFMPVYDWKKDRLIDELRAAKIRLPVDYEMFGRTFDGFDFRFLEPIRRRFPEDFRRILQWFPLADADIARRIFQAHEQQATDRRAQKLKPLSLAELMRAPNFVQTALG